MAALSNKVVFITGAARGIGAETARSLAARGSKLVLTDVDEEPLRELAAELGDSVALAVVADVRDLGAMQAAVDAGVEKFGGLDLVLANAGIASYGSVLQVDPEIFDRVLDINLRGVFNTARATLPSLIERKGYILIVSSLAAYAACPGLAAYNASKAGVEQFANALRLEVTYRGVGVGSAHMAWIDTPLVRDAKADLGAFGEMLGLMPGPFGHTMTVDKCVDAFVDGLEKRKRKVYVPRWVGAAGLFRGVLQSAVGDRALLKHVPRLLPKMDAEVAALGRSTSKRNVTR
ncbi:SDR family oxidoreductase [Rhodococcoides kyotonense]|uniref:NADP-dependent 3-hydroxy acid dehydrogenase YdfG n=1 Tax=Rhodococcoides kyotonense TaxID=398843 RepID=A0A239HB72_9NOCA|nr:SDR family oxidoreductase [Rhodococcus kyotonensis]SNS78637.1 NADP-dependent 3-hydroxy acid dehydrogenase YdfG [Rhodococcus kyotonensis]